MSGPDQDTQLPWNSAIAREIGLQVENRLSDMVAQPAADADKLAITVRQYEPDGKGGRVVTGKFYDEIPVDIDAAQEMLSDAEMLEHGLGQPVDRVRGSHAAQMNGRDYEVSVTIMENFGRQADGKADFRAVPGFEGIKVETPDPFGQFVAEATGSVPAFKK